MKSKTVAVWLTFLLGPFGIHRFYLKGWHDALGWALPVPSLLGLYGIWRVQQWGLDDQLSWILIPMLGFTIAGCAMTAIMYGLMTPELWNGKFNKGTLQALKCGESNWLTIGAIVLALFVGTAVLMASIAFSAQRLFEYQAMQEGKPGS